MSAKTPRRKAAFAILSSALLVAAAWAGPGDVTGFTAEATTPHSITLTWTPYDSGDFARYEIRRAAAPGVTQASTLVDSISSRADSTFTDSDLIAYHTYYYRVFVVDTAGVVSAGVETSARTFPLGYPHDDTVDSTGLNFVAGGAWAIVEDGAGEGNAHTGPYHWSDSPAGTYAPNTSASLTMAVDLSSAASPVLRFWERYSFEIDGDWGFVEVSIDGGATRTQEYFVTGNRPDWKQEQIDLSPYRLTPAVMIRFRLQSNGSYESEGWHVDDFEIVDLDCALAFPFFDDLDDSTASNWLTSSFEIRAGGRSGPNLMHDSPVGSGAHTGSGGASTGASCLASLPHEEHSAGHRLVSTRDPIEVHTA